MEAWKRRLAAYLLKEGRCPACLVARAEAQGTMEPAICGYHQRARQDLAMEGM